MNKELEEAITLFKEVDMGNDTEFIKARETILNYIENSIPKKVVEENINILKQTPRKEFCNYDNYTYGGIRALERIIKVK